MSTCFSKSLHFPEWMQVVATKNWPTIFHYATRARTQASKLEMIEGLYDEPKGEDKGQKGNGMVKSVTHQNP
jgi:hypothetical protein